MTSTHAPHLAQLFQSCLRGLAPGPDAAQHPALRLEQLAADQPAMTERPAVMRAAGPQRGVYYTATQFLANRPDTTVSLTVETLTMKAAGQEYITGLRPLVRTARGHRVAESELWGFSDGRQAYIRQSGTFQMLMPQGTFYTFVSVAQLHMKSPPIQPKFIGIPGGPGFLTFDSPNNIAGGPMIFALDTRTGQTGPYPMPGQAIPTDTAYVYVYRSPGGAPDARRLLLNNQEVGWLRPGDYLEVPCTSLSRIMRFSLDQPDGPALLVVPNASAANYLKLSTQPTASWEWMPPRLGEADVDVLAKIRKP